MKLKISAWHALEKTGNPGEYVAFSSGMTIDEDYFSQFLVKSATITIGRRSTSDDRLIRGRLYKVGVFVSKAVIKKDTWDSDISIVLKLVDFLNNNPEFEGQVPVKIDSVRSWKKVQGIIENGK